MIGCYGSLKGGNISEGMEDFTGGIARTISVKSRTPTGLWKILTASLSRGTLLSCFIQVRTRSPLSVCPLAQIMHTYVFSPLFVNVKSMVCG